MDLLASTPSTLLWVATPFIAATLLLALVRVYTTWRYYQALKQFAEGPQNSKKAVSPPQIPYTLPWLGNTFSFLAPYPGQYWNSLFSSHPRSTGICTLLIGGRKSHILFSPSAVQALFKARSPSRDVFERDLFGKVFQMSEDQIHNAEAGKDLEYEMNSRYLIKHERVNELTAHFSKVLGEILDKDAERVVQKEEVRLYEWLRDSLFTASTTTLLGEKLLQMYPTYCEDFYKFDKAFLSFFFDLPKFVMGDAYEVRDRILNNLEQWSKEMHSLNGGAPVDPVSQPQK